MGDAIEDEVKSARVLLHLIGVFGDDHLISTKARRVFGLVRRR